MTDPLDRMRAESDRLKAELTLRAEIERLRKERDEARRLAIAHQVQIQRESGYPNYLKETEWQTKRRIAIEYGWDCFQEGT